MILKDNHLEFKTQSLYRQVLAKVSQITTFSPSTQPFKAHCSLSTRRWEEQYPQLPQLTPPSQEGTFPVQVVVFPLQSHCAKQMVDDVTDIMLRVIF